MATTPQAEIDSTTIHSEPYLVPTAPETPTPIPEIIAALRTIKTLDGLTDEEFTWLATHGEERMAPEGAMIFREGEPAVHMNIILRGEIHVRRRHSGPIALFIGRAGQMTGKLPFSRMKGYGGDGYSVCCSWVFDIHQSLFPEYADCDSSMGQRCVGLLLDRVREVTRMEQQAEKLTGAGQAGLAISPDELNNPASAAQRLRGEPLWAAAALRRPEVQQLGSLRLSPEQTWLLQALPVKSTRERMTDITAHLRINPGVLSESDREDALSRWLAAHNVPELCRTSPLPSRRTSSP